MIQHAHMFVKYNNTACKYVVSKTHAGLAAAARRLEEDPGWRPAASLLREWLPNLPEVPTYRFSACRTVDAP
jgi:hypothetical protein